MKSFLKLIITIMMLFLFSSCNNSQNNFFSELTGQEEDLEGHQYSLEDFGMSIAWTAYKFTDRVSVSGTFQDYTLNEKNSSGSIENILSGLQLAIPTESIVTTNAIQDFKIKTYFFEVFNTPTITGKIINAKKGTGGIQLRMNNISNIIPYTYSIKNDTLVLLTHLDLKNWSGEEAIATLNKEWDGSHKITNGGTNVCPEIDVTIKLPLNKTAALYSEVTNYKTENYFDENIDL